MDIEKLIERLRTESLYKDKATLEIMDLCMDAATALSTLQIENQALRNAANSFKAENEKLRGRNTKLEDMIRSQRNGLQELRAELEHWKNAHHQAALNFQQENRECNKVLAELEQVKRALAMMWFAYINSDKEMPHSYETEALEEAERILGPWAECMPKYLRRGQKEG